MAFYTRGKIQDIQFKTIACAHLSDNELLQCKNLFDNHYGVWGDGHPRKGEKIKFPTKLYQQYREMDNAFVALAFTDQGIIGQAFYLKKTVEDEHPIAWVVQLVVHEDYRMRGVAKTLLYSIWGFSDDCAWGLATANALTVKTLEKATFRKVKAEEMVKYKDKIIMIKNEIPFAADADLVIQSDQAILNSSFPIDRKVVEENLQLYQGEWELGELPLGCEWLAFTFQSQNCQITKDEYDEMFENSEKIVNDAYNRMNLPKQPWNQHQKKEVQFILQHIDKENIQQVIDFGCGNGRHVLEFAQMGFQTLGVDYSEKNIRLAEREEKGWGARFIKEDCRNVDLKETTDLALCLYDVVGSFVNPEDNMAILQNIYRHLKPSGYLVMSVMNLELTSAIATNKVPNVQKNLEALAGLKPSRIMQKSGNVFNPDYFLLETETGVVYRKEQFENEGELSAEYAIRDKRYNREEICGMLKNVGFQIKEARYVQAGRWEDELTSQNPAAKEILIFAVKGDT